MRAFNGNRVQPVGECYLLLKYHNVTFRQRIAIVDLDMTPILGYYSSVKLGIIKTPNKKSVNEINKEL